MTIQILSRDALDFSLRPATPDDALCISVLGMQVFLDTYATDGIRPSVAREAVEHHSLGAASALLADQQCRIHVAERAQHMIAFAQITIGSTHSLVAAERPAQLNRLYVQEPFTGTGVGTALLNQAEAIASAAGMSALWLTSWTGNRRALTFYARRGYTDVGATTYVFENESYENRVFMKLLRGSRG